MNKWSKEARRPNLTTRGAGLTVDNPGHPPQPEQDEEANAIKRVLLGNVDDIQHERHDDHHPVKHLKLVVEELASVGVDLSCQLHHEEGEQSQAQVMEHLCGSEDGAEPWISPHEAL